MTKFKRKNISKPSKKTKATITPASVKNKQSEEFRYGVSLGIKPKQITYCEEYIVDLNQCRAAKRAGYTPSAASTTAGRLMRDERIQRYIAYLQRMRSERTKVTADKVLKEYARIAFFDIRQFYNPDNTLKDITDLDDDAAAVIAKVKVFEKYSKGKDAELIGFIKELGRHSKEDALDKLGKHLGMFQSKKDGGVNENVHYHINWSDMMKKLEVSELEQLREILSKADATDPAVSNSE